MFALTVQKIAGRMVAVDWALAKGAYDQAAATAAADDKESDDSEEDGSDEDDDGSGEGGEESDGEEDEEDEEAGEEEGEAKLQKERKKTLNLLDQMLEAEEGTSAGEKPGKEEEKKAKAKKKEKENEAPKEGQAKAVPKKEKDKGGIKTPEAGQINGTVFVRGLHLDVTKMVRVCPPLPPPSRSQELWLLL